MRATGEDLELFEITKYVKKWRCGVCNCRIYPGEECNSSLCIELREHSKEFENESTTLS